MNQMYIHVYVIQYQEPVGTHMHHMMLEILHCLVLLFSQSLSVCVFLLLLLQVLSESESSQHPIPNRAKERLQTLMRWQVNWEAILLDRELLQHAMQFYCMTAEWMTLVSSGGKCV